MGAGEGVGAGQPPEVKHRLVRGFAPVAQCWLLGWCLNKGAMGVACLSTAGLWPTGF